MVFSTRSLFSKNDSSRFVKILAYIWPWSIRMRMFETKDVCAFSSISHTIQWISDRFQQMSPKSNVDVAVFLRHCYFWSKIAGIDSPGFMYRFCYFFLHMMWKLCADLTGRYFSIFFWTDDMGINDQIYTWHGTQDVIVDFGFILENNFWRFHFWGAICGPVRPDNGTAGPWPNGQVFFKFFDTWHGNKWSNLQMSLDRWHGNKWSNLHMTWDSGCYCRFWIHFGKQFLEVPFLGCHLWPCPPRQWDSRSLT